MVKGNLSIVMYHYIRDLKNSRYKNIKGLDIEQFREQLSYLKRNYNFVSVEDIIASYEGLVELPSKSLLLTFDDGYIDHFTNVFPILKKHSIPAAFFPPAKAIGEHEVLDVNKIHFILASVSAESIIAEIKIALNSLKKEFEIKSFDFYFEKLAHSFRYDNREVIFIKRLLQVELEEQSRELIINKLFDRFMDVSQSDFSRELYMSKEQLILMHSLGMHIGSHGYNHYWLGSLSKEKQEEEIQRSVNFLMEIGVKDSCLTMCYPYGSYNQDTLNILEQMDFKLGFTTEIDVASTLEHKRLELPRLDTNDFPKNSNALTNEWFEKVL